MWGFHILRLSFDIKPSWHVLDNNEVGKCFHIREEKRLHTILRFRPPKLAIESATHFQGILISNYHQIGGLLLQDRFHTNIFKSSMSTERSGPEIRLAQNLQQNSGNKFAVFSR